MVIQKTVYFGEFLDRMLCACKV